MPYWVITLTTYPAFNLGFSIVFWVMLIIIPILIVIFLIKTI